ncbi:MAG: hypothetical protein LC713_05565 [Actinobacteria bacterium]|nr:hypothetical protein [Actinomycetota bacterium]
MAPTLDIPPEVRAATAAAAGRFDELQAQNRQIHFEVEGSRVRLELCDVDGMVLRAMSISEALRVAEGEDLH